MTKNSTSMKKFLATATTAVIAASSFAGVAGAAANFTDVNDSYKEAVDYLVSKGIKGTSETTFGTYAPIKRVDAAVFVVKALGLDVESAPASGFTDVPERAVKEVNALKAAGITSGKTATSFGAQDLITRGELAIWLDRAFELEGEGDISKFTDATGIYTEAIKALVANNITNGTSDTTFGTKDNAKRGDFAKFVKRAADTKDKVVTPKVSEVKELNAKQVAVTFNTEIDSDSIIANAETKALVPGVVHITAIEDAAAFGSVTGELSEDGKTLILTAANKFDGRYNMAVVGAESANGDEVESYTGFFNVNDTVRPAVTGVTYTNGHTAKITLSEPIDDWGTVSLNNTELELEEAAIGLNYILVDLSKLDYEEAATVTLVGSKDFAGNLISPNPVNIDVKRPAKDVTAPTVESMTVVSDTQIKVVFSEELASATFEINDTPVPADKVSIDKDTVTYYLNADLVDGVNKVKVTGFTDTAENDGEAVTRQLIVKVDKTAPEIVEQKVLKDKDGKEYLQLAFSEAVELDDETEQTFTGKLVVNYVTNANASFDAVPVVDKDDQTKVNIPLQDAEKGSWTIQLPKGFVNDLAQAKNDSAAAEVTFERGEDDQAEPADITVLVNQTGNKVTLSFSGKIDGAAAVKKENYTVEGAKVESAVLQSNNEDGATVELTFEKDSITANGTYQLTVSGLMSAAGAPIKAEPMDLELKENISPKLKTAALVSGNDIELTFSEAIKADSISESDFELLIGGEAFTGTYTIAPAGSDAAGTKFVLTLDANGEAGGTPGLNSEQLAKAITLELTEAVDVVDLNNNALASFESFKVVQNIK